MFVNYYAREKADVMALYKQLKASAKGYDVYLRDRRPLPGIIEKKMIVMIASAMCTW